MAVNQGPISWQSCRNVVVDGRRTDLRLENAYWSSLKDICAREGFTLNELCGEIERRRGPTKLTQALRRFVVDYYRRATPTSADGMTPVLDTALDTLF